MADQSYDHTDPKEHIHSKVTDAISSAGLIKALEKSSALVENLLEIEQARDQPTYDHSINVAKLAQMIMNEMIADNYYELRGSLNIGKAMAQIAIEGNLHDLGKLFFPDVLLKTGKNATQEDFEIIKEHPSKAYHLLLNNFPEEMANHIKHHHERWDGRTDCKHPGYPDGLKGKEIPLNSRILSVADSYDTMIEGRIYNKPKPLDKVINILVEEKGKQFDPAVVDYFLIALSRSYRR